MKRFIIISSLFILPIIVFLIGVEYTLRQIPNDYSYKAGWLDEHADEVEYIILGSSHAFWGIHPSCFSRSSFNAAHVSQPLYFDDFILSKYADRMDSLRYVILPISYFTLLGGSLQNEGEAWRYKYYVLYYDKYENDWYKYNEMKPLNLNVWHRLVDYVFLDKNTMSVDSLGWSTTYQLANKDEKWLETGATAAKRHTREEIDYHHLACNVGYIDHIIEIANMHNAKVVLLNTPTHTIYREHLNITQWQLMDDVCDSIAEAHNNVYRLNYFSDTTFVDDDFYDADHLSEYGAKRLSTMISNALDSLSNIQ